MWAWWWAPPRPEQLATVRGICPDVPLLIPGVGSQGGDLENAVRCGVNAGGRRAVINSSRGIIYASDGADFPKRRVSHRRIAGGDKPKRWQPREKDGPWK